MSRRLSDDDVRRILRQAEGASRRHGRRLGLPEEDREDLRQDLLVDLLARLPAFDPARGTIGAFAETVFAHRAHRFVRALAERRRLFGAASLDEPLPEAPCLTRGDLIAETDGHLAMMGQPCARPDAAVRGAEFEHILASLSPEAADLAHALIEIGPTAASRRFRTPRSTFYRRIDRLRLDLLVAGIVPPSWDRSARA